MAVELSDLQAEIERLRAEVERMTPVVAAARRWRALIEDLDAPAVLIRPALQRLDGAVARFEQGEAAEAATSGSGGAGMTESTPEGDRLRAEIRGMATAEIEQRLAYHVGVMQEARRQVLAALRQWIRTPEMAGLTGHAARHMLMGYGMSEEEAVAEVVAVVRERRAGRGES